MATRFYFPKSGTPAASPDVSTGWEYTASGFSRLPLILTKTDADYTSQVSISWPGTTAETGEAVSKQYVSAPLDVDQTISGTVSFVIEGWESATTADAYVAVGIRVLQGDTSIERGVLRVPSLADTEISNGGYYTLIANAVAVSTVNALAGDRIVVEIGARFVTPAASTYCALLLGAINGGTDLALTSAVLNSTPTTSTKVPWLELSTTITFNEDVPPAATVAFTTDDAVVAAAAEINNAATVAFTTDDAVVEVTGNIEVDGSVAFTTDDAVVEAAGVVDGAAAVAFTTDDAVVAATGDSGMPTATVAFTTDDATVAAAAEISNAAAVAFTTDDAVVAAVGSTTTAPPTERFSVTVRDAITGALLTGLTTVMISVNDDADGAQFDYTDNQFRAVAAVRKLAMDEVSAANAPGEYAKSLQVMLWTGDYTITIEYNDGTRVNAWVASSIEYLAGVRIKVGSRAVAADVPSAADIVAAYDDGVIDGAITRKEMERMKLAIIVGDATFPVDDDGNPIPGAYAYKGQDGATTRVGGTESAGGARTTTTLNGAP